MGREHSRSRPVPFQQRTNTSWWSMRPQPADSRRLFRCLRAHLLRSPWIVKSGWNAPAGFPVGHGHTTSVASYSPSARNIIVGQVTSLRCRVRLSHNARAFRSRCQLVMPKQKTLLPFGKQGEGKIWIFSLPAYLRRIQMNAGHIGHKSTNRTGVERVFTTRPLTAGRDCGGQCF